MQTIFSVPFHENSAFPLKKFHRELVSCPTGGIRCQGYHWDPCKNNLDIFESKPTLRQRLQQEQERNQALVDYIQIIKNENVQLKQQLGG